MSPYMGTTEPCVGLVHLIAAFPRLAFLVGMFACGTIGYHITKPSEVTQCIHEGGFILEYAGYPDEQFCIIEP